MLQNKRCLIFDFDGTIADSFHIHEQAFKEALKHYPVEFEYGDYAGRSTVSAIRQIFASNNYQISEDLLRELTAKKQKLANEQYKNTLSFIPGAEEFIKKAFERDYVMAIASSGSGKNIQAGIDKLAIGAYFKAVVTSDNVMNAKPHPEIFETALLLIKGKKEETLVLEDAQSGILAADAAGIDVVCVNPLESVRIKDPLAVRIGYLNFIALKEMLD